MVGRCSNNTASAQLIVSEISDWRSEGEITEEKTRTELQLLILFLFSRKRNNGKNLLVICNNPAQRFNPLSEKKVNLALDKSK